MSTFHMLCQTVLFFPKSPDYKYSQLFSLMRDIRGTRFFALNSWLFLLRNHIEDTQNMAPRNLNLCN